MALTDLSLARLTLRGYGCVHSVVDQLNLLHTIVCVACDQYRCGGRVVQSVPMKNSRQIPRVDFTAIFVNAIKKVSAMILEGRRAAGQCSIRKKSSPEVAVSGGRVGSLLVSGILVIL